MLACEYVKHCSSNSMLIVLIINKQQVEHANLLTYLTQRWADHPKCLIAPNDAKRSRGLTTKRQQYRKIMPYDPCMEYLPRFTINLFQLQAKIPYKYSYKIQMIAQKNTAGPDQGLASRPRTLTLKVGKAAGWFFSWDLFTEVCVPFISKPNMFLLVFVLSF